MNALFAPASAGMLLGSKTNLATTLIKGNLRPLIVLKDSPFGLTSDITSISSWGTMYVVGTNVPGRSHVR